ncbi:glycosyltransferase, partial [Candidatus Parcubacteria bacterium]|nr:glycosyltransferase [Candidatus Parcubacteria bacterium]
MYLSVIIPAYNEEKNIQATLEDIFRYLKSKDIDHEIIVVTDGSKDETADIVSGLTNTIPTLRLIEEKVNHGKGYATKRGMLEAKGDLRIFTDADNATTMDNLERLLPYIEKGYDVVIGSIALKGKQIKEG